MTKTLSLPVCRKLKEMGIEVESNLRWTAFVEDKRNKDCLWGTYPSNSKEPLESEKYKPYWVVTDRGGYGFSAYTLDELPAVLRAIGEKKIERLGRMGEGVVWQHHFLRICELYAQSGSLGEGSEASKYLEGLL